MKKTYTKKQIVEAIKHWQGVLKKMNESMQINYFNEDGENQEILRKRNPYKVAFNYWFEAENSYGGGLIGATSKESLKQYIKDVFSNNIGQYKCSKPYVFLFNDKYVSRKISSMPIDSNVLDVDTIVNKIVVNPLKDVCVGFAFCSEEDDEDQFSILVFEAADDDMAYEETWFEDAIGFESDD